MTTDADKELGENGGQVDNVSLGEPPVWISTRPHADLQVESVVPPDELHVREDAAVSWTVRNFGTGATAVAYWYDSVYLSINTELDSEDLFLVACSTEVC